MHSAHVQKSKKRRQKRDGKCIFVGILMEVGNCHVTWQQFFDDMLCETSATTYLQLNMYLLHSAYIFRCSQENCCAQTKGRKARKKKIWWLENFSPFCGFRFLVDFKSNVELLINLGAGNFQIDCQRRNETIILLVDSVLIWTWTLCYGQRVSVEIELRGVGLRGM